MWKNERTLYSLTRSLAHTRRKRKLSFFMSVLSVNFEWRPNGPNRHPFVVLESSFAQTEKSKISSSHDAKKIINFKQELQFKNFNRIFIPSHESKAFICWHTTIMMMGMFDSIINDLKTELKKIKTTIEDLFTASNNFHR
jgi:hypothetical protein